MATYLQFEGEHDSVLVEVNAGEVAPPEGVEQAGRPFKRRALGSVAAVQADFSQAVESGIQRVADAVSAAVLRMPHSPSEVEVTFGLKATGELGNMAIARAGAEANLEVRLRWVSSAQEQRPQP